jgi:biotin-(acetyl-CoA carboxylase) ligase
MVRQVFESDNLSIETIIAKTVLNKFFALCRDLKNPSKYMDVYRNKFALTDKKIKLIQDEKKTTVRVMGIDKNSCALVVEAPDGKIINVSSPMNVIIPRKL